MNKKGFTVVELIVTFVFVMTITIGLMNLVISYRNTEQKVATKRKMTTYKNQVISAVENDVYRYTVKSIKSVDDSDVSNNCGATASDFEFDSAIEFVFNIRPNDGFLVSGHPTNRKYLCISNKGGSENNFVSVIKYGDEIFEAPDSFVRIVSDISLHKVEKNEAKIHAFQGNFYIITIKLLNEDIDEYFDIKMLFVTNS